MLDQAMEKTALKTLNFSPRKTFEGPFPVFVWRGWALNGFDSILNNEVFSTHDISHADFNSAITSLYPELSFSEMSRLCAKIKDAGIETDLPTLIQAYGYRWDQKFEKAMNLLQSLPVSLQTWVDEHQASLRDFYPLNVLPASQWPETLFAEFQNKKISRATGAQILNILVELLLLDHRAEDLVPGTANAEAWLDRLKKLRHPLTEESDRSGREAIETLPWTKDFSLRWQRQGDQSGMEVKFHVQSPADLKKKLQTLNRITQTHD